MSYNSYKQSFRGGRGFGSRGGGGGYRGSRDSGGGTWATSSGGRGRGFSSRGSSGRFGGSWEKEGGSYESQRYSGGGDYGGSSSERYSSRGGRGDDGSFGGDGGSRSRRYARQGSPLYGSRENNHRGSPDPPRKRMRSESSYQGSMRRSHEESFGGSNDYSNRSFAGFGGSEEKGGAGSYGEKSRAYREERSRSNDYYRKVMGPPLTGAPRRSSPRGSFRGGRPFRGSRPSIGFRGRGFGRAEIFPRFSKKRLMESSYNIRKKEILRRLKLYKLKRLADRLRHAKEGDKEARKRSAKGSKINGEDAGEEDDDDDDDDDDDEEEVDEEEVEVEEEVETSVEEEDEEEGEEREEEDGEVDDEKEAEENGVKKEDEELEEGETHEDGEVPATKKKQKKKIVRKKVKKIIKKKIKKPSPKKRSKDASNDNEDTKEGVHDSESRAVNEEGRKNYLGRPFIRLECRHCNIRCVTFKEYSLHLHTTKHIASMRRLALKLRQQLARMRIEQRKEQRVIDEQQKENSSLRTLFCSTCKLNHRSLKGTHMTSARHRKMREFLMPYCNVCRLTFRSPMGYENHLCELDHIKQASKMEYLLSKRKGAEKEESERNVDMDNFMILDSVGSPDESDQESDKEDGEKEKTEDGEEIKTDEKNEKKKKKKSEIKLGIEYCKQVEVMFCDLCNIYLPRNQSQEKVVAQHCRTRVHLERLVRVNKYKYKTRHGHSKSKDDKDETDKQEINNEKQDGKNVEKSTSSESSPSKKKDKETNSELEEADIDEKLWSEVDKDLGDLLREVEPEAKSSDDEEEKGRYDRFKLSEKDKVKKEVVDDEDEEKQAVVKKSESSKGDKNPKKDEDEEEDEEEEDEEDEESKEKSEA